MIEYYYQIANKNLSSDKQAASKNIRIKSVATTLRRDMRVTRKNGVSKRIPSCMRKSRHPQ